MLKSLIKATNEVRVETEQDADLFHKELQKQAEKNHYTLSSFTKTLRQKKAKGEIIEEYYQIKYTFVFNSIKEPQNYLQEIQYIFINSEGEDAAW